MQSDSRVDKAIEYLATEKLTKKYGIPKYKAKAIIKDILKIVHWAYNYCFIRKA